MLLLGVVLVIVVPGILANGNSTVAKQDYVQIYGCVATPDTVIVHNGGYLHWVVPDTPSNQDVAQYFVLFDDDKNKNPLPGAAPTVSLRQSDPKHKVMISGCTVFNSTGCADFKYSLIQRKQDGQTTCPDPIVRVVPPSLIGMLLQNLAMSLTGLIALILLAYVAYRTFARN